VIRASLAVAVAVVVAGSSPVAGAPPRQDAIDRPTDTHVTLVAGLWHDDVLNPGEGWHRYEFIAAETGAIAFQMQAPAAQADLWPYLLIMDATTHDRSSAGVGNRRTNLCEVIVEVEAGKRYDVIATSQQNAVLPAGQRQRSHGRYTVAALPVRLTAEPVARP
jgi:hypothetical protein